MQTFPHETLAKNLFVVMSRFCHPERSEGSRIFSCLLQFSPGSLIRITGKACGFFRKPKTVF